MPETTYKPLEPWQRRKQARLRETPFQERKDLECPLCGASMRLKLGQYGRFYGCVRYNKTECKGAISALDNGTPRSSPVPKKVQGLRKHTWEALNEFLGAGSNRKRHSLMICRILGIGATDLRSLNFGDHLDEERCGKLLEYIEIHRKKKAPALTAWERLSVECLLPSEE